MAICGWLFDGRHDRLWAPTGTPPSGEAHPPPPRRAVQLLPGLPPRRPPGSGGVSIAPEQRHRGGRGAALARVVRGAVGSPRWSGGRLHGVERRPGRPRLGRRRGVLSVGGPAADRTVLGDAARGLLGV